MKIRSDLPKENFSSLKYEFGTIDLLYASPLRKCNGLSWKMFQSNVRCFWINLIGTYPSAYLSAMSSKCLAAQPSGISPSDESTIGTSSRPGNRKFMNHSR